MREHFTEQLSLLNKEIILMGSLCEQAITKVFESFEVGKSSTKNVSLKAKNVTQLVEPLAQEISEKERTIESLCLKILLSQQPVARDLRQVSAALKMITDMARIGEQAEDIADIIPFVESATFNTASLLHEMAFWCIKMVTTSVDAFVKQDLSLAKGVLSLDDEVDAFFCKIKQVLTKQISGGGDGEEALDLFMIAKYLERIGDHATNVAQWVIFALTGEHCSG